MADYRLVHNTTSYALVVSARGVRVLANSTREIDITEPRAQKYLASGDLILVAPVEEQAPEPAPAPEETPTETTNGE